MGVRTGVRVDAYTGVRVDVDRAVRRAVRRVNCIVINYTGVRMANYRTFLVY
jgi:hypothetical protein